MKSGMEVAVVYSTPDDSVIYLELPDQQQIKDNLDLLWVNSGNLTILHTVHSHNITSMICLKVQCIQCCQMTNRTDITSICRALLH